MRSQSTLLCGHTHIHAYIHTHAHMRTHTHFLLPTLTIEWIWEFDKTSQLGESTSFGEHRGENWKEGETRGGEVIECNTG